MRKKLILSMILVVAALAPPRGEAQEVETGTEVSDRPAVFAVDLDRDGDIDLVSAAGEDAKLAWYESDGSQPPVFTEHSIATSLGGARSVYAKDVDGDGDNDILVASLADGSAAWYENDGGLPPTFTERNLSEVQCPIILSCGGIVVKRGRCEGLGHHIKVTENSVTCYDPTCSGGQSFLIGAIGEAQGSQEVITCGPLLPFREVLCINHTTGQHVWAVASGEDIPSWKCDRLSTSHGDEVSLKAFGETVDD